MNLQDLAKLSDSSCFIQIELNDMIKEIGEEEAKSILSYFSCPLNPDVEKFLKYKAIEFSKRGFAKTTVVYWVSGDGSEKELVGYYTVADKVIQISNDYLSSKDRRALYGHSKFDESTRTHWISAPLIAQLGKNFTNGNDTLISGKELLQLAMTKVEKVNTLIGTKMAYLECEDKEQLTNFYKSNGFKYFGERKLDRDESDLSGSYLLQFFTTL